MDGESVRRWVSSMLSRLSTWVSPKWLALQAWAIAFTRDWLRPKWLVLRASLIDWACHWAQADTIRSLWHPPDLEGPGKSEELIREEDWASGYVPARDGEVYSVIVDFARKSYEEAIDLGDTLDKKADDLMKISGTIGAAIAAAGRVAGLEDAFKKPFFMILAIAFFVLTMLICARARKPAKKTVPMSIRAAIEVTDQSMIPLVEEPNPGHSIGGIAPEENAEVSNQEENQTEVRMVRPSKSQMQAGIAVSYYSAMVGVQIVAEWKARQLNRATLLFCMGLVSLVLAFLRPIL